MCKNKKVEALRSYYISNCDGPGLFVVDSKHNTILCHTDYGDYNYAWNAHGCKNIAHFLIKISMDYAMGKFRGNKFYCFDSVETRKQMLSDLIMYRKAKDIESDQARAAYNQIRDDIDFQSSESFHYSIQECDEFLEMWGNEFFSTHNKKDYHCVAFWEKLWLPFIEELKKDDVFEWGENA